MNWIQVINRNDTLLFAKDTQKPPCNSYTSTSDRNRIATAQPKLISVINWEKALTRRSFVSAVKNRRNIKFDDESGRSNIGNDISK